jgi:hypothetical protein
MSQPTLEERVAALEHQMAELQAELARVAQPKDWRSTIGMFAGDEMMKRIDAAGQAIREKERQRARRQKPKVRRAKK